VSNVAKKLLKFGNRARLEIAMPIFPKERIAAEEITRGYRSTGLDPPDFDPA
jgi:hypothetical protein